MVLQLVGAVLCGAARGLVGVQAGVGVDVMGLGQFLRIAQVGIMDGGGGRCIGRHAEQSASSCCGM